MIVRSPLSGAVQSPVMETCPVPTNLLAPDDVVDAATKARLPVEVSGQPAPNCKCPTV